MNLSNRFEDLMAFKIVSIFLSIYCSHSRCHSATMQNPVHVCKIFCISEVVLENQYTTQTARSKCLCRCIRYRKILVFVIGCATKGSSLDLQLMLQSPRLNRFAFVDCLSTTSPARTERVYPINHKESSKTSNHDTLHLSLTLIVL